MLRRCAACILLVAVGDAARVKPSTHFDAELLTAASVERVWGEQPSPDEQLESSMDEKEHEPENHEALLEETAQTFRMREQFRQVAYGEDLDQWRANVAAFLEKKHAVDDGDEARAGDSTNRWVKRWAGKLEPTANAVGRGAFGKVYVATIGCSKTKVAVKQMKCRQSDADEEANTMKAFSTPHFVHYFDHGKGQDGSFYIMMEAALGDTLGKIVDGRKPASTNDRAQLLVDMLSGIDEMHAKQVVHRDLKPANVLVSRTCGGDTPCHAKIADLGLSCSVGGKLSGIPKCGGMAGTPLYIAPETYSRKTINSKNDMWALGLIYYEMLWAHLPKAIENSKTMQDLEMNVRKFQVSKDVSFKAMPAGPQKDLLSGMLTLEPSKRMSAKQALEVAKQLLQEEDPDVVGELPDCWVAGVPGTGEPVTKAVTEPVATTVTTTATKPVTKPVTTTMTTTAIKPEAKPADKPAVSKAESTVDDDFGDEGADFFTIPHAANDIEVSLIFNKDVVNQESGIAVASEEKFRAIQKYLLQSKLKPRDTILEVNDLAFSKLTVNQKDMLKKGLLGRSLTFKVLRA